MLINYVSGVCYVEYQVMVQRLDLNGSCGVALSVQMLTFCIEANVLREVNLGFMMCAVMVRE